MANKKKTKKPKHLLSAEAAANVEALTKEASLLLDDAEDLSRRMVETMVMLDPQTMMAKRNKMANNLLYSLVIAIGCGGMEGVELEWREYLVGKNNELGQWLRLANAIHDVGIEEDAEGDGQ